MAVKSPISSPPSSYLNRRLLSRSPPSYFFIPSKPLKLCLCGDVPRPLSIGATAGNPSSGEPARKGSLEIENGDPASTIASSSSATSAIDFLTLCHRLKTTKRKGWINHGIKGPESIADHMYRMSLMALIAGDIPGLNRERCIKIAIVHDIAEAIVGDITPSDGVPKAEKSRREQAALEEMCEILGGGLRADEIKELWAEYENNSSIESSLVKDFDKVAKGEFAENFKNDINVYKMIWDTVHERWRRQLYSPLHTVAYYLNPQFYYNKPEMLEDSTILDVVTYCVITMITSTVTRDRVIKEQNLYIDEWWDEYETLVPELKVFVVGVLDLMCNAFGCKRN